MCALKEAEKESLPLNVVPVYMHVCFPGRGIQVIFFSFFLSFDYLHRILPNSVYFGHLCNASLCLLLHCVMCFFNNMATVDKVWLCQSSPPMSGCPRCDGGGGRGGTWIITALSWWWLMGEIKQKQLETSSWVRSTCKHFRSGQVPGLGLCTAVAAPCWKWTYMQLHCTHWFLKD